MRTNRARTAPGGDWSTRMNCVSADPAIFGILATQAQHFEAENRCLECPVFARCDLLPKPEDGYAAGRLYVAGEAVDVTAWHASGEPSRLRREERLGDAPATGARHKRCAHPPCGRRFRVQADAAKRLYCSESCQHKEYRRRKRLGFPPRTCMRADCTRTFDSRAGDTAKESQYCSNACREICKEERSYAAKLRKVKTCARASCGQRFSGRPRSSYCCEDCTRWAMGRNHPALRNKAS